MPLKELKALASELLTVPSLLYWLAPGDGRGYRQTAVGELGHPGILLAHWMPRFRPSASCASAIIASTSTCGRRISSWAITPQIVHYVRGGGDNQGVGLTVRFDNDIFIQRRHQLRGLLSLCIVLLMPVSTSTRSEALAYFGRSLWYCPGSPAGGRAA